MKRVIIIALAIPLLMSASCSNESSSNGGPDKTYPTQIPATERFPVIAWHGVRSSFASVDRFKEVEQMGVTIDYSRRQNVETALRILDLAAQTNVKLIVEIDEFYRDADRAAAVKALMGHKALAGYFMFDEPHPKDFAGVAKTMREIQAIDSKHICYCNILPNGLPEHYEILGVKDYTEYVTRYLNECPTTFLSFDKYPIVHDGTNIWVQDNFYEALEVTSREAVRHNMDLWAFLLTTPHGGYPQPTPAHLRLQGYSNLAYGVQVLQCFTYWTPDPSSGDYHDGPIAADGTRTATYDLVKNYLDEVQKVAWIFRGCKVEGVWHLGGKLPVATKPLTTLPAGAETITIDNTESALVSVFTNHGYTFMLVQNTNVVRSQRSYVKMKPGVQRIMRDGSVTPASEEQAVQTLEPGDVRIYMW